MQFVFFSFSVKKIVKNYKINVLQRFLVFTLLYNLFYAPNLVHPFKHSPWVSSIGYECFIGIGIFTLVIYDINIHKNKPFLDLSNMTIMEKSEIIKIIGLKYQFKET